MDDAELKRFIDSLDKYEGYTPSSLIKFILLTGWRKSEGMFSTWDQFDLENGLWIKSSHLTKQKRKERLPLSDDVVQLLSKQLL